MTTIPVFRDVWSDFQVALALLTRLPIRLPDLAEGPALTRAARFYPVVGLIVGLVGAGAFWLATGLGLPAMASGLIAVGATILVTGAFHEDGLADLADGFGGAFERSRKLEIMHDPRVGTYGALALILSVALRAAALAALVTPEAAAAALVAAHGVSRALLPAAMVAMPLARSTGLAAAANRPTPHDAGVALALAAALALLGLGLGTGLAALIAAALGGLAILWLARIQIGGYTGDVLGAAQQGAESAVLLAAVALA